MTINISNTTVSVVTQANANIQALSTATISVNSQAQLPPEEILQIARSTIDSPIKQNLSNLIKVSVNRPEIVSIFEFVPLVKDENADDALFNLSSDQEFSLDLTSASLLLEKQIVLRRLSDISINEYIYSFGGRDYSKLLLNDEFKNKIRETIKNYFTNAESIQNDQALIELFSFDNSQNIASELIGEVKTKIADISLEQDTENSENITDQNNLQNENNFIKNIQTTSSDFNLLINQNLDSPSADQMLTAVIEYFVNEVMLERLITEIISYSIFIEKKKVLLDNI